jgi:hypothetical protein
MTDDMPVCEVEVRGLWTAIDLSTALRLARTRFMRCVECHGRVRAHREGSTGQRAHMEHDERHPGCSRGDCFDGHQRRHHRAIA